MAWIWPTSSRSRGSVTLVKFSPTTCGNSRERRARRALVGDFELNMIASNGGISQAEAEARVRLFAESVLPELHA